MNTDLLYVAVFEWVAYDLQQSLRMYLRESLLSSFRLVPECRTHPEDQIRTYVIGLIVKYVYRSHMPL